MACCVAFALLVAVIRDGWARLRGRPVTAEATFAPVASRPAPRPHPSADRSRPAEGEPAAPSVGRL